MNCYEVKITKQEGFGHKTKIWAESYQEVLKKLTNDYGIGSDGIGCSIKIVQPEG